MALSIYTPEHKLFITALWDREISASDISDQLNVNYGLSSTRLGIIGLAHRIGLDARGPSGKFREEGTRKRLATMAQRGIKAGPKPKTLVPAIPVPSEEPIALGKVGEHIDSGCRWISGDIQSQFQYCAHDLAGRGPYCPFHQHKARGAQAKPSAGSFRSDRIR